jgi:hypothetical protein
MAHHASADQLLLFGGANYRSLSDTWIWRPEGWSRATTRSSPLPRHDPSIAYDADSGELVLFGGAQATGKAERPLVELEDTWVWDGSRWREGPQHGTPVCGVHSLMAFDPKRHQMLLVTQPLQRQTGASGSESGPSPPLVQTWLRADRAWSLQECTSAPVADGGVTADPVAGDPFLWPIYHPSPFDAGASMAFDPITEQVILYQCNRYRVPGSPAGRYLTWGWDGEAWTLLLAEEHRINTAAINRSSWDDSPRPLLATEPQGTGVLQLDGFGRTWHWDGRTWSPRAVQTPGPRARAAIATSTSIDAIVLFGGIAANSGGTYADTWGWDGDSWFIMAPPVQPQVIRKPPDFRPSTGVTEAYAVSRVRNENHQGLRDAPLIAVKDGPLRQFLRPGHSRAGMDAWVWAVVVGPVEPPYHRGSSELTTAIVLIDYETGEVLSTMFPAPASLVPRGTLGRPRPPAASPGTVPGERSRP